MPPQNPNYYEDLKTTNTKLFVYVEAMNCVMSMRMGTNDAILRAINSRDLLNICFSYRYFSVKYGDKDKRVKVMKETLRKGLHKLKKLGMVKSPEKWRGYYFPAARRFVDKEGNSLSLLDPREYEKIEKSIMGHRKKEIAGEIE